MDRIVNRLVNQAMKKLHSKNKFIPGESSVPVSGKVFGKEELANAVRSSLDFWLTSGPYTDEFESKFAAYVGTRHAFMVNSGSSANLLAISSLTSKKLGDRALRPGDEVITVAAGFPTTVTPIIQNNLIPMFIDIDLETYVANDVELEAAITPKTKAIMMAHTLGNPFNLNLAMKLAEKHNLWLIEDSCDALGGTYEGQKLGSFGDLSTFSFYPAHHITTGEGGAVLAKKSALKPIVESFRNWGRDCWCAPGCDNTCFKRYQWELGELPYGYDHKYTFSHLGYNLKSGDIQAAIGLAQLNRIDAFTQARKNNWSYLRAGLSDLGEQIILPKALEGSDPSWFGFLMTVREGARVSRNEFVKKLNEKNIDTRLLFGGNLIKQPAFSDVNFKTIGKLHNSDIVMNNSFWIGVWPGLSYEMLDYVITVVHEILWSPSEF